MWRFTGYAPRALRIGVTVATAAGLLQYIAQSAIRCMSLLNRSDRAFSRRFIANDGCSADDLHSNLVLGAERRGA